MQATLERIGDPESFIYDPSLVLYVPLYHQLDGASFMSKDAYGHLCTVTGAKWTPQGRDFDGLDDKITLVDDPIWQFTRDFTILCWVNGDKWDSKYYEQSWLSQAEGTTEVNKWFYTYAGNLTRFEFYVGGEANHRIDGDVWTAQIGVWYLVGVTRTGSSYTFYKDGEINGTGIDATTIPDVAADFLIGYGQGTSVGWDGKISSVQIYSRALTPLEIQHNYLATKWRYR